MKYPCTKSNNQCRYARQDSSKSESVTKDYHVERLMYCFQESLPASRPPPVAFSPPKAPPISAPLVGIFTFTIPQSLPCGLHHIWMKTIKHCSLKCSFVMKPVSLSRVVAHFRNSPNPFKNSFWLACEDWTTQSLWYRIVQFNCFFKSLHILKQKVATFHPRRKV